ncbi:hypothetical protein GCM10017643_36800 [Ancylobacter dichloromethanicus]|uniref:Uncharacterized protein n=2 Tax=Ancylobacter dichloromethanicus TaxID=518825 RepID=A0A9W6JC46_9HYPH|nr:hypothetical protein GCM10017643_36800 [Ancylobacter dichloromethanicus]
MPTKKQLEEADRLAKEFDWSRFDAMSDADIRAHWAWDKDMTWPTEAELAEFDLVLPAKARRERAQAEKAQQAGDGDDDSGHSKPPREAAE